MDLPIHVVSAAGIIENDKNEILMVRLVHRGWEYPGGIIESGESIIDGLIREIREESGIDVEVITLLGVYSCTNIIKRHDGVNDIPPRLNFDFYCKPIGGSLQTSDETNEVKWIPKESVLEMIRKGSFGSYKYQRFLENTQEIDFVELKSGVDPIKVIHSVAVKGYL